MNRAIERFDRRWHRAEFRGGPGIAVAADGTVYVDADPDVFATIGAILAVRPDGHVSVIWHSGH
jgi:hypothetical protein